MMSLHGLKDLENIVKDLRKEFDERMFILPLD